MCIIFIVLYCKLDFVGYFVKFFFSSGYFPFLSSYPPPVDKLGCVANLFYC